jgi:hypothetical protein
VKDDDGVDGKKVMSIKFIFKRSKCDGMRYSRTLYRFLHITTLLWYGHSSAYCSAHYIVHLHFADENILLVGMELMSAIDKSFGLQFGRIRPRMGFSVVALAFLIPY